MSRRTWFIVSSVMFALFFAIPMEVMAHMTTNMPNLAGRIAFASGIGFLGGILQSVGPIQTRPTPALAAVAGIVFALADTLTIYVLVQNPQLIRF